MPAGVDLCPRRRVSSRRGRFFAAAVATPASASAHCPQTPGNQRHWGRSRGASRSSAPRRRWVDLRRCAPPTVSASRLRETLGTPRLSGRFGAVYSASTAHLHLGSGGNGGRPRPSHVLDGRGWFRRKVPFRGGAVAALFVSPVHPPTGDRVVTKEPSDFNPVTTVTTVTSLFYILGAAPIFSNGIFSLVVPKPPPPSGDR